MNQDEIQMLVKWSEGGEILDDVRKSIIHPNKDLIKLHSEEKENKNKNIQKDIRTIPNFFKE